jgi:uncharacterized OsmC-like protein
VTATFGMLTRQQPLQARYRAHPEDALIVDRGRTEDNAGCDPLHGTVIPGSQSYGVEWRFGIHSAVGGDHDLPNPGDILCAALAACLDSTIRMIADRMAMPLHRVAVDVRGEVDVRGTLRVSPDVPVGFRRLHCAVTIEPEDPRSWSAVDRLVRAAEYSCVVLQTLRRGVPVELRMAERH